MDSGPCAEQGTELIGAHGMVWEQVIGVRRPMVAATQPSDPPPVSTQLTPRARALGPCSAHRPSGLALGSLGSRASVCQQRREAGVLPFQRKLPWVEPLRKGGVRSELEKISWNVFKEVQPAVGLLETDRHCNYDEFKPLPNKHCFRLSDWCVLKGKI